MSDWRIFPTCAQESSEILRDFICTLIVLGIWLIFFFIIPLIKLKGKSRLFAFLFWCNFFLLLGTVLIFTGIQTISRFHVYRENIYDPRLPVKSLKIFLISDIHLNNNPIPKKQEKLIQKALDQLDKENPDFVAYGGDSTYHCNNVTYRVYPLIEKFFDRLSKYRTYFVIGNHDQDCVETYRYLWSKNNATLLYGSSSTFEKDNETLHIHGNIQVEEDNRPSINYFRKLLKKRNTMKYSILLSHVTDPIQPFENNSLFDLALFGHSHGGQVTFRNTLWSTTRHANWILCTGIKYHTLMYGTTIVHVSRGLGITYFPSPQVRFGVVPEVSVLTIYNNKSLMPRD